MSHSIHIFYLRLDDSPLPRTLADFGGLLDRYDKINTDLLKPGWNEMYVALAKILIRKFPWKAEAERDENDEIIWLNDPVAEAQQLKCAVWNFEIPRDSFVEVLAFMHFVAKKINLALYDDNVGIGFLPDGSIVPAERAALIRSSTPKSMQDDAIRTTAEARKILRKAFEAELGPSGFRWLKTESVLGSFEFERRIGPVFQRISARALMSRHRCDNIYLSVGHDQINEVIMRIDEYRKPSDTVIFFNATFFHGYSFLDFPLYMPQDAEAVARFVREKMIPIADISMDLFGIDQLLTHPSTGSVRAGHRSVYRKFIQNRPNGSDGFENLADKLNSGYVRQGNLVAAWLNANPRYAELEDKFLDIKAPEKTKDEETYQKELAQHVEWLADRRKFANHLRTEVQPLVTWNSAADYEACVRPFPAQYYNSEHDPLEPRLHNKDVACFLEKELLSDPQAFMTRFGGGDGHDVWAAYWRERGETMPEDNRIVPDGLAWERKSWEMPNLPAPIDILILTLPPVEQRLDEMQIIALAVCGDVWMPSFLENQSVLDLRGVLPSFRCTFFRYSPINSQLGQQEYTSMQGLKRMPTKEEFYEVVIEKMRKLVSTA